jgi:sarcosine oxidase subunit gamma
MPDASAALQTETPSVSITEGPVKVCVLRLHVADDEVAGRLGRALGLNWPSKPNSISGDKIRVAWLAPGEWAIFQPADAVAAEVSAACEGRLHHLTDDSAAWRVWRIEGPASRDFLAQGCSLDLHPKVFAEGGCAQTLLAQVRALIVPLPGGALEVFADASLAGYLNVWFADAATGFRP